MMLKFLSPFLLPAGTAVLVFSLLFGGSQWWLKSRAQTRLAELQTVIANERAQAKAAGDAAEIERKETEKQWIEAVQDGQKAIDQAKQEFTVAISTVRAAASADAAILRLRIDEASSGEAASGTTASGSGIAATCGDLLAEALSVASEHTVEAERHADTVRALLHAWPVNR